MCEKLNCLIKKGYFYCKDTGERCPDGLFDKPCGQANYYQFDVINRKRVAKVGPKNPYQRFPILEVGYKPPIIYSERESEGFKLPNREE
jgi:hypothetical protein